MAADKNKILITVLVVIVLVLLAVIAYTFVVSPRVSGYVVDKQVEGYQIAVLDIARTAAQCQTVPIQVGEGQTINLIAVECLQQAQGGAQGQPATQ